MEPALGRSRPRLLLRPVNLIIATSLAACGISSFIGGPLGGWSRRMGSGVLMGWVIWGAFYVERQDRRAGGIRGRWLSGSALLVGSGALAVLAVGGLIVPGNGEGYLLAAVCVPAAVALVILGRRLLRRVGPEAPV